MCEFAQIVQSRIVLFHLIVELQSREGRFHWPTVPTMRCGGPRQGGPGAPSRAAP